MSNYFKKITASLLILTIIAGTTGIPRMAEAQLATVEVNSTPSLFQQIAQTLSSATSAFATYSLEFKAFVLDTLATTLAKQLIRSLTASVVNWINSGFEGSPSFVTNPGSFFLDVADQITGAFLAKAGGPLTELCSPFSIDIRIALAFKYHPNIQKKYTCTLGAIIKNSKNAVQGASINGFTAGDFRQGGWPAFVSLTTQPQNNVYGAYFEADSELSLRVAKAQLQQKDEIGAGRGFLSWRDRGCLKKQEQAKKNYYTERPDQGTGEGDYTGPERDYEGSGETANALKATPQDCPINTPGSVIVSSLETTINSPQLELALVDSINEIVSALAAQLVTRTLQGGLRALSGGGPSDSTAYINQVVQEGNTATDQVTDMKNNFIKSVEKYISDTLQYKTNKDQSLNLILDVKNKYDDAKKCYDDKIAGPPPLQGAQLSIAENKKTEIDSALRTNVTPVATKLLAEAKEADTRYVTLTTLRDEANAAKTVNELNAPTQKFALMLQNQSLTDAADIVNSQQELGEVRSSTSDMNRDAERKVQECQIFR